MDPLALFGAYFKADWALKITFWLSWQQIGFNGNQCPKPDSVPVSDVPNVWCQSVHKRRRRQVANKWTANPNYSTITIFVCHQQLSAGSQIKMLKFSCGIVILSSPSNCKLNIMPQGYSIKKVSGGVSAYFFSDHPPPEYHFFPDHPPPELHFFPDHPPPESQCFLGPPPTNTAIFSGPPTPEWQCFLGPPPPTQQLFSDHSAKKGVLVWTKHPQNHYFFRLTPCNKLMTKH